VAKKLKTYTTTSGFFDLAIAAPSMKAAAEAWGSNIDVFKNGFAAQTEDLNIIAATLSRPGVVLKRPVGSAEPFSENPHLPKTIDREAATVPTRSRKKHGTQLTASDKAPEAQRDTLAAFMRQQERIRSERRKAEKKQEADRVRRDRAIAAARVKLQAAEANHQKRIAALESEKAELDMKFEAEEVRWQQQEKTLKNAVKRGRSE
jgi:colicin import membrane protein